MEGKARGRAAVRRQTQSTGTGRMGAVKDKARLMNKNESNAVHYKSTVYLDKIIKYYKKNDKVQT